jgi:hypothetical protein
MKNTVSTFDQETNLIGMLAAFKTSVRRGEAERVFSMLGGQVFRRTWTYSGQQIWDIIIIDAIPTILGGLRR